MEVVVLFTQQAQAAGFEIVSVQAAFPDAIIRLGDAEYKVEFEYKASNFWTHRHNPTMCDLIICWVNDDEYPILPIIELSNPDWPQTPITPPPYHERLVGYWKSRALIAEAKLEQERSAAAATAADLSEKVKNEIIAFAQLIFKAKEQVGGKAAQEYEKVEIVELEELPDWLDRTISDKNKRSAAA
jgi:hypothetical protein